MSKRQTNAVEPARRANLLLQVRTRVLNEEWENTFRSWYPAFLPRPEVALHEKAA
jgi:hypothetical protein